LDTGSARLASSRLSWCHLLDLVLEIVPAPHQLLVQRGADRVDAVQIQMCAKELAIGPLTANGLVIERQVDGVRRDKGVGSACAFAR